MPAVVALALGGCALLVASFVTGGDAAGRLLITVGAVGLWIIAGLAAYQRPRLWMNGDALSMKRLSGISTYRREEIVRLAVVTYPRLGRRVPMLEIDVRRADEDDERLIIFGRWDLGAAPHDVFEVLDRGGLVPRTRP